MRALVVLSLLAACRGPAPHAVTTTTNEPAPPIAERRAHAVSSPNGTRDDPYYWIRDDTRKDRDMLTYLAAENAYAETVLAPAKSLEDTLFAEFRARIKEDDSSVPTLDDGYWYYTRYETGKQQPIYARRKQTMTAPEQILLDGNQLETGHAFYRIGAFHVSPDDQLLAWADDTVGRNQFVLHVKKLATGELLADTATNISPQLAWSSDGKTLFYVGKDTTTLREDRVMRHALGGGDEIAYKEDDASYYVGCHKLKSKRFIAITMGATTNSEVRLVDVDHPTQPPRVAIPRTKDHLYSLDHLDGRFVVLSNEGAKNYRVIEVPEDRVADRAAWRDVIPHRADAFVEDIAVYRGFYAATVRTGGLSKVQIVPRNGGAAYYIDASDPTYAMNAVDTPDADASRVRFAYNSLVVPTSIYEQDVATKKRELLKRQPVPGYDETLYASEYVHVHASDGAEIPISIVYKKTTKRDGTAPVLVYGYGSYGFSMDPALSTTTASLLDRGWVYAIAHIRGGQELGRAWYDDGHLMHKKNTFTDFIAASEYLVAQRYAARDLVFAEGGSAGGLLMGAIANMRPDLFRGIVALVPFVDVVTTMLDETIPLTTNEFDEWGNPKEKAAYDYMLSYSPYDNVAATGYPAMFVHTGLWDSQVQYYEPTKWVAKLRATKTDRNPLLLDIDMSSGHGGASGRFDRLKLTAKVDAFLLWVSKQPDTRARR